MQKINVELISNFINKNNLTKTKFCKLCGISLKTLNKFYNNDFSLTIPQLIKVLKVYPDSCRSFCSLFPA